MDLWARALQAGGFRSPSGSRRLLRLAAGAHFSTCDRRHATCCALKAWEAALSEQGQPDSLRHGHRVEAISVAKQSRLSSSLDGSGAVKSDKPGSGLPGRPNPRTVFVSCCDSDTGKRWNVLSGRGCCSTPSGLRFWGIPLPGVSPRAVLLDPSGVLSTDVHSRGP